MTFDEVISDSRLHGLQVGSIARYLSNGGDINHRGCLGRTLLHHAGACGDPEAVHCLAYNGADLNIPDDHQGWTPLHLAVDIDIDGPTQDPTLGPITMDTARALIEAGAREDIRNEAGETPRDIVAAYGLQEYLDLYDAISREQ